MCARVLLHTCYGIFVLMMVPCAGYDASMFTLSLPRNYQNQQIADFARVEGLPGVYMANQLEASIFDDPSSVPYDKNYNDYLQTKVSVVLGGSCLYRCQAPLLTSGPHQECMVEH